MDTYVKAYLCVLVGNVSNHERRSFVFGYWIERYINIDELAVLLDGHTRIWRSETSITGSRRRSLDCRQSRCGALCFLGGCAFVLSISRVVQGWSCRDCQSLPVFTWGNLDFLSIGRVGITSLITLRFLLMCAGELQGWRHAKSHRGKSI